MTNTRKIEFRSYRPDETQVPVTIITPDDGYYIHTFFDIRPWSPSGRYLACLKLPFQDRIPGPDDEAVVCIIDLQEQLITEVAASKGWGMQVGAHICWGSEDHLYFNDKEGCEVYAVEYNRRTGQQRRMAGSVYQVTPDGHYLLSPSLRVIDGAQNGYGATMPEECDKLPKVGASDDEGLWMVDVKNNVKKLLFSLKQAYNLLPDKRTFDGCRFSFFHTKINPQQDRIMQVVRCLFDNGKQKRFIVTFDMDGKDPHIALPYDLWLDGSHHPDWHPNGRDILMNIKLNEIRFCTFGYDGRDFKIVAPQALGGGHPSFSGNGRVILTDAYTGESVVNEKKEVPIRLVDAQDGTEQALCYIWTLGGMNLPGDLRCDPHPVWSRDNRYVCFNGAPEGKRQLLIADMGAMERELS